MIIAFDTNVILDAILQRDDSASALALMKKVLEGSIEGVISANTVTDLYYISSKKIGVEDAREAIYEILNIFDVAPIDGDICMEALGIPMNDYEDALLALSTSRVGAECVASRDEGFIKAEGSPIPSRKPSDVIAMIE